eukprot:428628-Lingulodinium_polyedra.AAC.1
MYREIGVIVAFVVLVCFPVCSHTKLHFGASTQRLFCGGGGGHGCGCGDHQAADSDVDGVSDGIQVDGCCLLCWH